MHSQAVARIDAALKTAQQEIEDLDLYILQNKIFCKGDMKKCKLSPDAVVQMALQLAYFKVYSVHVQISQCEIHCTNTSTSTDVAALDLKLYLLFWIQVLVD